MISKIVLFWFFGIALTYGIELSLKSVPGSGNLEIQIEPQGGKLYFLSFEGDALYNEVLVTEKDEGQFGNYSFTPFLFSGFRLYKTSKKIILGGSQKEIFEFYKKGITIPVKLVANDFKKKGLKNLYEEQQQKALDKKGIEARMVKDCGKLVPFSGNFDSSASKAYEGILELCLQDKDYREGIVSLKEIKILKGNKKPFSAEVKNQKLTLELGSQAMNPRFIVKEWLEKNL